MRQHIVLFVVLGFILSFEECAADCFFLQSCTDNETVYQNGDLWSPSTNPCYSCVCFVEKVDVAWCMEKDDSEPAMDLQNDGRKKSALEFGQAEFEIEEFQAVNFTCPPEPLPYYDIITRKIEYPNYKLVRYVKTTRRESHCCKIGGMPRNIHPLCTIKKINQCEVEVVLRENEDMPCTYAYDFVGDIEDYQASGDYMQ